MHVNILTHTQTSALPLSPVLHLCVSHKHRLSHTANEDWRVSDVKIMCFRKEKSEQHWFSRSRLGEICLHELPHWERGCGALFLPWVTGSFWESSKQRVCESTILYARALWMLNKEPWCHIVSRWAVIPGGAELKHQAGWLGSWQWCRYLPSRHSSLHQL